ncbi:response regulator transcription factor [Methylobacterium durans]|nr:response regulator transcription factor [Methylobacterium durans]
MSNPQRVVLVAKAGDARSSVADRVRAAGIATAVIESRGLAEARRALTERPDIAFAFIDFGDTAAGRAAALLDLRLVFAGLRVVALAKSDARGDVLACLEAGASGFIPTSLEPGAFAEAVASVCAGRVFVPASLSALPTGAASAPAQAPQHRRESGLTARQADVLGHLRAGRSNRDIARRMHVAENTVKVHIHTIFRKLGISRRQQLINLP